MSFVMMPAELDISITSDFFSSSSASGLLSGGVTSSGVFLALKDESGSTANQ